MKRLNLFFTLVLLLMAQGAVSQERYCTRAFAGDIKTIQVIVNGDVLLPPIIGLNSLDEMVLKFDKLDLDETRLRYRLVHCNADFLPSGLSEVDYLSGFNDQPIHSFRFSENTTVNYIHYRVAFPNEEVQMKLSGNYAIEVYEENNPHEVLLQACFSVVEPLVRIGGEVSGKTDIDINKAHQQLRFEVFHEALPIRDAEEEITILVRQNNRLDNERRGMKPSFVFPGRLVFEHQKALIFEGGNEYRRFETVNKESNGLNVAKIYYEQPYFNARLLQDENRSNKIWQYDKDQNGRFFIRNRNASDSDVEADYFMTHFTFDAAQRLSRVFLNGDFTYPSAENHAMHFDAATGLFRASVLLKQGSYNYQYVTAGENGFTTTDTEGNYFNTENEYMVMVYHRAPGSRYDKLVGWAIIRYQHK